MEEMRAKTGQPPGRQWEVGHHLHVTDMCISNQARQERPKSMQHLQFMWEVRVCVCVRGMIR